MLSGFVPQKGNTARQQGNFAADFPQRAKPSANDQPSNADSEKEEYI